MLQVVQIFAYLLLFRPKLLLIDEPDAHLHADKQERLIEALEAAAHEYKTQIVLTTHSPFIARAASTSANLVWLHEGSIVAASNEVIRRRLGWGGLDKLCVFFVEDEDDTAIRTLLRQWPQLNRQIQVCRCFGIENLPKSRMVEGLIGDDSSMLKVVVHRDRDFMTPEECAQWKSAYTAVHAFAWITEHVDVEAYFCQHDYLARLYSVDSSVAERWIEEAVGLITAARDTFLKKRALVIRTLYPHGGSPNSEALWTTMNGPSPKTVLGKKLLPALRKIVKDNGRDEHVLARFTIPEGIELAGELRLVLEQALAGAVT